MENEQVKNQIREEMERLGLQQSEKLKLFKNTKGYNWEIQILEADPEKLEKLNNKLMEKFGSVE